MARIDVHNKTSIRNVSHIPDLSLLNADFTTQSFSPHAHEALVVAVTESGGARISSRGEDGEAKSSRMFVFNPGEPHSGDMGTSERWRYRGFYLPKRSLALLKEQLRVDKLPYFLCNGVEDDGLAKRFLDLHANLFDGNDEIEAHEKFSDCFGSLFDSYGDRGRQRLAPAPKDESRFDKARELIRDQYSENLSLEDIAASVNLSIFQLIGLFKRCCGMTPHTYLTQTRLRHACRQLREGELIVDVALQNGFYDQSALTNHFKKSFGITPLQFQLATKK